MVAPLVGAWIEISSSHLKGLQSSSLPLWERGLKLIANGKVKVVDGVAPLVGAWIEICANSQNNLSSIVAPLVGAWIEIYKLLHLPSSIDRRSPCGSVD